MLYHKMSSTIKYKSIKFCLRRRHNRQQNNQAHHHNKFTNILMLSIIWTMLFTETMARPNLETLLSNKSTNDINDEEQQQQQQQQLQQDFILDEIMANTNNDKFLNKLKKYHNSQPNFLNKWPGLRDLVLNMDYDDAVGLEESNEYLNAKFFERLRQLASTKSESYDEDVRDYNNVEDNIIPSKSLKSSSSLSANQLTFKDHNIKKNVQFRKHYMSPCHFKICNMGRKRNARLLKNY